MYGTVTSLATALEFPISVLKVKRNAFSKDIKDYNVFSKDSARPEYWVPDAEITSCSVCDRFYSFLSSIISMLQI